MSDRPKYKRPEETDLGYRIGHWLGWYYGSLRWIIGPESYRQRMMRLVEEKDRA